MNESKDFSPNEEMALYVFLCTLIGSIAGFAALVWHNVSRENLHDACARDGTAAAFCRLSLPWIAMHPIWTGLIVFGAALVIGRALLFMHRMESRAR